MTLEEYPVSPLEARLADKLSGGKTSKMKLAELFEKSEAPVSGLTYTAGYGAINEIGDLLTYILENEIPPDKCVIACAAPAGYSQIFYDLSLSCDIPMTFGSGIPITNSSPAKLLRLVYEWDTTGYHGIEALKNIVLSEAFNRNLLASVLGLDDGLGRNTIDSLCKTAGSLRISFDGNENEKRLSALDALLQKRLAAAQDGASERAVKACEKDIFSLELAKRLAAEFGTGLLAFIEKYAVIRPEPAGRIDKSAVNVIRDQINAYIQNVPDRNVNEIIPKIMAKSVRSEISREGALHITSIQGAMASMRDNLFICGLSASQFPGSPSEDHLLLDNDLLAFGDKDDVPSSGSRIRQKKKDLSDLLCLASGLGAVTRLSWPEYDLAELKELNPSSVLFTCYAGEHPGADMDDFSSAVRHAPFFRDKLSGTRYIGEAYAEGKEIGFSAHDEAKPGSKDALGRDWSPSALDIFFKCPRRFYLKYIAKIPDDEPDDPAVVISPADFGTLAHSMMEQLANNSISTDDFIEKCSSAFDDFLITRPPMHDPGREKNDFLRMMTLAYGHDPHNEVLSAEEAYYFTHPSGVRLWGYPDRVEKDSDGKYIIADFKTKRKIEHTEDDIDSCLQVVIYAWLCEQAGIGIDRCEYRYLRKSRSILCRYDGRIKEQLAAKLEEFRSALEENSFPRTPGKNSENCKYCTLNDICEWPCDKAEEEDE